MARGEGGGRPKVKLDESIILKLGERHWSDLQIAATMGCHEHTIKRRFGDKLILARQRGCAKLVDILWQRAVHDKRDRVLMHLADRFLGAIPKSDKMELTGKDGAPLNATSPAIVNIVIPSNGREQKD
jgi:hypothetical protein